MKARELLAQEVTRLLESDTWRRVLEVRARLHSYSFGNCLLLYAQRPDASMVAGYRRWQALGRQVRKGEKGMMIFAPLVRKDDDGEVFGYKTAYVFDIAQTDGEEIPTVAPKILTDDSPEIQTTLERLERYTAGRGLELRRQDLGAARGAFIRGRKIIILAPDLPPLQAVKTWIHELGHALMHDERMDNRATAELEAESCAFLVCHSLGLDTSGYSFPYLAHWTDDPKELLPAGERAQRAADEILTALGETPALALAA